MADNTKKTVKDGKILTAKEKRKLEFEKAKKKINDPNYNVASGEIQKSKNNQTNVKKNIKDAKKRKESYYDVVNGKKVLKKRNIVDDIGTALSMSPVGFLRKKGFNLAQKIPGVKGTLKKIGDKIVRTARNTSNKIQQRNVKGQGSGKFINQRKNRTTGTQITKPKNTQVKTPSTSLVNRPNQNKISSNRGPNSQQLANRAVVTSGLSELIKPKKSIAKPIEKKKPKKDFGLGGTDQIKKPSVRQGPPKGPLKSKPVKKKSRSNISNSSSYDADFTRKGLEKRGLKAKNFMSPKNFESTTKEKERKIGIAGNFNTGGKMVKRANNGLKPAPEGNKGKGVRMLPESARNNMGFMRGGGKVVKMRGGGAATRGMNFNRGR